MDGKLQSDSPLQKSKAEIQLSRRSICHVQPRIIIDNSLGILTRHRTEQIGEVLIVVGVLEYSV